MDKIIRKSIDFNIGCLNETYNKKTLLINTINTHSYVIAINDYEFRKSLENSDFIIPDGIGIVYGVLMKYLKSIKKFSGYDLHNLLLEKYSEKSGGKFLYVGSTKKNLNKIKKRIFIEYNNIEFKGYSPPFKKNFSKEEIQYIVTLIKEEKPDVLFLGLTAPKQEKISIQLKNNIEVDYIASIGAVFDFFSNPKKRAPKWMIKLNLEWLHRLINDPLKIANRVFISTPKFFVYWFFTSNNS